MSLIPRLKHTVRGVVGKKKNRAEQDIALLSRLRSRKFPTPRQLFQIGTILSFGEKIIFGIASAVLLFSLVGIGLVVADDYRISTPKVAGTYREGVIGSPQSLNPLFSPLNEPDQDIVSVVYSGLLRYDAKRRLVPDLAVKYDLSEDKKTYTFELKQNVKWHDGEPFTANDIVYTFELIQDSEVGSLLWVSFQNVVLKVIDDHTVSFTLSQPFPSFIGALTVGILPEHIWSQIPRNQIRLAQRNLQPIGTGPFRFKRLVKNQAGFVERLELERFSDFYRNPSYLKELHFQFFGEYDGPDGLVSGLREGLVDGVSFVPYEYHDRVKRKHITLYTLQLPQYTALFFNQKNEILKDKAVRSALAKAIDKDRILGDVLDNEAEIISGPILPGFPGYTETATSSLFSIEEANTELDRIYERVSQENYRQILLDERVAARVALEQKQNISSSTPELAQETATTSSTASVDLIRDEISKELDLELDPAQLFYRHKKGVSKKNVIGFELVTASTPEYAKVANIIAGHFQEIGIKITVRLVDTQDITREVLRNRSYDMLLYGEIIGSDPDQYPFWHSSQIGYPGLNLSQYASKKTDEILEKIRTTENAEELVKLYTEFGNTIMTDIPAVFLYTPTYTYALTDTIKGFDVDRIAKPSDRFANILEWYMQEKKVWKKSS